MANGKKMTEEEIQSELILLKNSYDMYEASKKEMVERRENAVDKNGNRIYSDKSIKETMELMETMQQDIEEKYLALGGNIETLKAKKRGSSAKRDANRKKLAELVNREGDDLKLDSDSRKFVEETKKYLESTKEKYEPKEEGFYAKNQNVDIDIDKNNKMEGNKISFDTIPLPSHGECYKHKMDKIPVSYLTAYDENLIVSPNLYKDGTFIDYLLKAKIMTSKVNPDELLPGDRDAIILWLRGSGYGPEYPITVRDDKTGENFETTIDLTTLNFKPFKLKGDENGYFDFKLPFSGDVVKFKFLNYKETKALEKISEEETSHVNNGKLIECVDTIKEVLENDDAIERATKLKVTAALKEINTYADTFSERDISKFSHAITNKLSMSIVSINDISDRKYVNDYIMEMNVKDSFALRKYITENEPGIDFNISVQRPESLGGGSINTFLQFDQFIFLNLT